MAGDDDTTADPSFKNVLRRPRKKEPNGDDPGGSIVTNASESPPATSSAAASNNRPSSIGKLIIENNSGDDSSPSVVGTSSTKATTGDFFPNKAHVSDALRTILAGLDASDLKLVYEKHMEVSDRSKGQNRLLMSCKCESKRASFASIFTESEMPLVHRPESPSNSKTQEDDEEHDDDDEQGKQRSKVAQGLAVEAYDCDGRMYNLNLKYLSSNTAYRIIGHEWAVFLENNALLVVAGGGGAGAGGKTRKPSAGRRRRQKKRRSSLPDGEEPPPDDEHLSDIHIELWAFRSPKLSVGVKDQPGGALGLLPLHCRVRGGGAGTEKVVAAAQEAEDMFAAGDCGGDAATVVDDAAGANKLGDDAAPRSSVLGPVERLIAVWLSYNDQSDDNGEPDDTQGPK